MKIKKALLHLTIASCACAALAGSAHAIDTAKFAETVVNKCLSGSCTNGDGTLRLFSGVEYTGRWDHGSFAPNATYKVNSPVDRKKVSELFTDKTGGLDHGTELRGSEFDGVVGEYTGTFAEVPYSFSKGRTFGYRTGKYTDNRAGYVYDGEFSFIPKSDGLLVGGLYVFQGARIDRANDEVIRGIFVSDVVWDFEPLRFTRARPDYLAKVRREYEANRTVVEGEKNKEARQAAANRAAAARAAEDERQSAENFANVLGVMAGFLVASNPKVINGLSRLTDNPLATLTDGLTGQRSSADVLQNIVSQIVQEAGGDPTLAQKLGNTSDIATVVKNLTGLAKGNQPMTVAQYEAQLTAALTGKKAPAPASTSGTSKMASAAGTPSSYCVNNFCSIGDGRFFCSGPPVGSKECQSECTMDVGYFYHDTRKRSDRAYIGNTDVKCHAGSCNAYCGPASPPIPAKSAPPPSTLPAIEQATPGTNKLTINPNAGKVVNTNRR